MIVTISVPKKRLSPIFFLGFFISPAIKVTLFQASLEKIEPTMAAAIAPSTATPETGVINIFHADIFHAPGICPVCMPDISLLQRSKNQKQSIQKGITIS